MCPGVAWVVDSSQKIATHFRLNLRRRHILRKCVTDRIRKCALEGAGRAIGRCSSLRTSALTPNRTQQKAHWPEVRDGRNPRMRPGGAWDSDSLQQLYTHFRLNHRRRHILRKCVTGEIRECTLEGSGWPISHGVSLRTSTPPPSERRRSHIGRKCAHLHRTEVPWRGMGGWFGFCISAQVQGTPCWRCVGDRFAGSART